MTEQRAQAAEAIARLADVGLLDPAPFAEQIAAHLADGFALAGRLAQTLADASSISALAGCRALQTLEALLPRLVDADGKPMAPAAKLIELAARLSNDYGMPIALPATLAARRGASVLAVTLRSLETVAPRATRPKPPLPPRSALTRNSRSHDDLRKYLGLLPRPGAAGREGASLRALYDAMLGVQSADLRAVDASPRRLREMAQGWSQRPNFVPIRLNELFNGLQVEHTMTTCWPWSAGWAGGTSRKCGCSCCAMTTLRDQVFWRVFEVEGGGEISLANIDKFSREEFNWHNTVVLLANEGTLGGAARALPGGAQPGFLRLSRRLVLARVCVPGAHARRNGGGPAAAAPVPGFVDHRHCLAGRQAAGGPAQARPARRRALRASLRRRGAEGGGAVGAAHAGGAGRAGRGRVRRGGAGAGFGPGASACRRAAGGGEGAGQAGP